MRLSAGLCAHVMPSHRRAVTKHTKVRRLALTSPDAFDGQPKVLEERDGLAFGIADDLGLYLLQTPTPSLYSITVPNGFDSSARCSMIFLANGSGAMRGVPRWERGAFQLSSIG